MFILLHKWKGDVICYWLLFKIIFVTSNICIFLLQFIDFTMGAESGYIRFEEAGAAQKARAAAVLAEEGGLMVKNYVAILDPVTGRQHSQLYLQCCRLLYSCVLFEMWM